MKRFTPLVFILFMIYSCDPGFSIILSNKSGKNVLVKIVYSDSSSFNEFKNYIPFKKIILKDSTNSSLTFLLDTGKDVKIVSQMATMPPNIHVIVINNVDTVSRRDKRTIVKKRWMYKDFITTIK